MEMKKMCKWLLYFLFLLSHFSSILSRVMCSVLAEACSCRHERGFPKRMGACNFGDWKAPRCAVCNLENQRLNYCNSAPGGGKLDF